MMQVKQIAKIYNFHCKNVFLKVNGRELHVFLSRKVPYEQFCTQSKAAICLRETDVEN